MSSRTINALLALGLLLATAGCPAEPSASTGTASAAPSTSAKAASSTQPAGSYADADLKVAEDFAAEADKEITAENYKEKLAELTQEIDPKAAASAAPDASGQPAAPDASAKAAGSAAAP